MGKIFGISPADLNFGLGIETYCKVKRFTFYIEVNGGLLLQFIEFDSGNHWFVILIFYIVDFQKLFYHSESRMLNFLSCRRN